MSVDPWRPPDWHVTVPGPLTPVPPREGAVRWPADAWAFVLTTVFVVLTGPVVGLLWSAAAPKLALGRALGGSASAYRAEIGADLNFLLLSATAGLVCAAIAVVLRLDGPGVLLGLVVGGLGAAVVADRVGFLVNRDDTLSTLHRLQLPLSLLDRFGIDPFFKVRALGVLVAWPMAALVLFTVALAVRGRRR